MKRIIASCLIIAALFTGVVFGNRQLTAIRKERSAFESMAYLPGSERIKPFMLGFNTTYAHYLWIKAMIYTGDQIEEQGQFDWLVQMIDMITRLHPHFNEAYEFAGLMIPDLCRNPDAARVILERGMNAVGGSSWNVPFYLGMLHFRYYGDRRRAADYFSMAAQVPSRHQGRLASLAAAFYNKTGNTGEAMGLLSFMYETSENPEVKRHIAGKMEEIMNNE